MPSKDLVYFEVAVKETNLLIGADRDLSDEAYRSIIKYRSNIEQYAKIHEEFLSSFVPLPLDRFAPDIVKEMLINSGKARVGPMASVAGAIAQFVARDLLGHSSQVVVENGGDIYADLKEEIKVGIFAAESPLSNKLVLKIRAEDMPMGICTSSATVGHSVSLGRADAVCVLAKSAVLADAAASAVGNAVRTKADIRKGIDIGAAIEGVLGIVIVIGDGMGAFGQVEFA